MKPAGFCPQCDYPIDPGVCSECGTDVSEQRLRRKPRGYIRRNVKRITVIIVFVLTAGAIVGTRTSLVPSFPSVYLLLLIRGDGELASAAASELATRWNAGELSEWEMAAMTRALSNVVWIQQGGQYGIEVPGGLGLWWIGVPQRPTARWRLTAQNAIMPAVDLRVADMTATIDGETTDICDFRVSLFNTAPHRWPEGDNLNAPIRIEYFDPRPLVAGSAFGGPIRSTLKPGSFMIWGPPGYSCDVGLTVEYVFSDSASGLELLRRQDEVRFTVRFPEQVYPLPRDAGDLISPYGRDSDKPMPGGALIRPGDLGDDSPS